MPSILQKFFHFAFLIIVAYYTGSVPQSSWSTALQTPRGRSALIPRISHCQWFCVTKVPDANINPVDCNCSWQHTAIIVINVR